MIKIRKVGAPRRDLHTFEVKIPTEFIREIEQCPDSKPETLISEIIGKTIYQLLDNSDVEKKQILPEIKQTDPLDILDTFKVRN